MKRKIIYKRIYEDIFGKIKSGELAPGAKIPTERELKSYYNSSLSPVRKSLGILENQGLIKRVPGQGTKVAYFDTFSRFNRSGFAEYYTLHANKTILKNLSVDTVKADEETSLFFNLKKDSRLLKISNLRLVDNVPVALKHTYVPFSSAINNNIEKELNEFTSKLVQKSIITNEEKAYESLSAVIPPKTISNYLNISNDKPVLYVVRRSLDLNDNPVEFAKYWARTDVMKYNAFLSE